MEAQTPLKLVENLISTLIQEGDYTGGLKIIQQNKPRLEGTDLGRLEELHMKLLHLLGRVEEAYQSAVSSYELRRRFTDHGGYFLAATLCHGQGNLQLALEIFQKGLEVCSIKELKERYGKKIKEITATLKERSDQAALALLASESSTSIPPKKSKSKRDGEPNEGMFKDEEEVEIKEIKPEGDKGGDGEGDLDQDQDQDHPPKIFEVPFTVHLVSQNRDDNFYGKTSTDYISLDKLFVVASTVQAEEFSKLRNLCSSHPSLLTLETVVTHPRTTSRLLVCEFALSVDDFFDKILKDFPSPLSIKSWWDHISTPFWQIFRDISRALLFLFKENTSCGNVGFSLFVTPNGRGKILPSIDVTSKQVTDVKDLVSKMISVITFPFSQPSPAFSEFLPRELNHFISTTPFLGQVPPSLLVDHPCFWTIWERVDFIPKLSNLLRRKHWTPAVQWELKQLSERPYKYWERNLYGVYREIWRKGSSSQRLDQLAFNAIVVQKYQIDVDIVRFFGAVYKHFNNAEYKTYRHEELTDDEIERDLIQLFPNFYIDMFSCLCSSLEMNDLDLDLLKLVSSCYYRDEARALPRITEKEPVCILVANPTRNFINALCPLIGGGEMLGKLQPVILRLYEDDLDDDKEDFKGGRLELTSAGYPLLIGIILVGDVIEACKGVDVAILCDRFSYQNNASALAHAAENCKVLVVSNNAHINASIVHKKASSINTKNITFLTRVKQNRAIKLISDKLGVKSSDVRNVIIWSNETLDFKHAKVKTKDIDKFVRETDADDEWLYRSVEQSAEVEVEVELARAACDHIHDWVLGTPEDTWTSMGVYSDGSLYNVEAGIFHPFPVFSVGGEWKIVEGLGTDD